MCVNPRYITENVVVYTAEVMQKRRLPLGHIYTSSRSHDSPITVAEDAVLAPDVLGHEERRRQYEATADHEGLIPIRVA